MVERAPVVIIGDRNDAHADAVAIAVEKEGRTPFVVDAASLSHGSWRWTNASFEVRTSDGWIAAGRGWLRRLAPPDWHRGIQLGSLEGAESSARLALLTALGDADMEWLTSYFALARAESKLLQHAAAKRLGVMTPPTTVCSSPADLPDDLGAEIVVKPLGVGEFLADGVPHAVHAREMASDDPRLGALASSPFILQHRINAVRHLRIVTVEETAWTCSLEADGLPVDWREEPAAHRRWVLRDGDALVASDALRIAKYLGLGYSSQDWIVDRDNAAWFIDLNPAGQWLFLPEPVASDVTDRIASWLVR
jgi:hypothetical protein